LQCCPEEIRDSHAGNFAWILESQKQTASCSFIRLKFQEIFAIHRNFACDHAVIGMSSQNLGQRAFARAIWPHQSVHFAERDAHRQTAHYFLLTDGDA
jgi:hypothetical protein